MSARGVLLKAPLPQPREAKPRNSFRCVSKKDGLVLIPPEKNNKPPLSIHYQVLQIKIAIQPSNFTNPIVQKKPLKI